MPSFRYQSLTAQGRLRDGMVTAADRVAAVRLLSERGETPTAVVLVATDNAALAPTTPAATTTPGEAGAAGTLLAALPRLRLSRRSRPVISRAEMASLIRQLATALEAGLPIMQALRTMRRQSAGRSMSAILDHFIERVEAGTPLYQAAEEYGHPFDNLLVGMLRAADASGNMTDVLHQLADLLERSLDLRREVLGATLYPLIVATLVLASAVIFITVLIPRLIAPLAGEMVMPLPTRILMGIADLLSAYWYYLLLGAAAGWVSWRMWVRVPSNRLRVDTLKLRWPVLGRLLRDVAVARFTRTLGTLVAAGIPILDALRITRDTLGNAAMMHSIDEVQTKVTAGAALAEPLERSGLFPPLLVQVVNLGERSGRLEQMLMHAAGAFDRQVSSSIKLFTRALPPVLILIMAVLGAFVLSAILLPLLELQSVVQ